MNAFLHMKTGNRFGGNTNKLMKFKSFFMNSTIINLLKLSFIISIIGTLLNCSNNKKSEEISEEIVLKIGNVEITKYEFERNKSKYVTPQTNYKSWLSDFIDNTYILTDAYEKKFDTIQILQKKLNYAALKMMGQVNGYLWNKVEEPKLKISKDELQTAYEKRNKVYFIEYIRFSSKNEMDSIIKNNADIENEINFNLLVTEIKQKKIAEYNSNQYLWPFDNLNLLKNQIYNLKQGQIKTEKTSEGIYIIHLLKKENITQPPFDKEIENIEPILKQIKTIQIAENKQNEIFEKTKIKINNQIENKLLNETNKQNISNDNIKFMNEPLMEYYLNNEKIIFTVNDYYDYRINDQFLGIINNKQSLTNALQDYVIEKYLFLEAEKLRITQQKNYLLDRKNYLNTLLKMHYENEEFYKPIKVTDSELIKYYTQNSAQYVESKISYVSVFIFKNLSTASESWGYIKSKIAKGDFRGFTDTTKLKGLISYKPNIKIDRSNTDYPTEIINSFLNRPEKTVTEPLVYGDKSIIFYKVKEDGKSIEPFYIIKEYLKEQVMMNKYQQNRQIRLNELKDKYKILIKKI